MAHTPNSVDVSGLTPDEGETVDAEASERDSDAKLLATAHARLKKAVEAEHDMRALALEDLKFRAGEQWPDDIKASRGKKNRPCLTINRIPQFIQQVTNDQRQNRSSIKAHPVDDQGDVETGKVIQGLIRHIEYDSNADTAYDTAFESAVTSGLGYLRVTTDYVSPLSFDQEIKIKRIRNPFSVFFDPYSEAPDGSDADWAFVVDDLSPDEYKAQFPQSALAGDAEWEAATGNGTPDWMPNGGARVAEYFYKENEAREIVQLSDGRVVLAADSARVIAEAAASGVQVTAGRTRKAIFPVIKWCKVNAVEVLEKREWPGIYIPVIPVYGTELYIDGKRTLEGIVRNAKDSQRMYNYWKSAETEAIALAPRTPWIAAEGQIEGHEADWATANTENHSVLLYKPVSIGGTPVGAPQRNSFEPAIGAITQASMGAADDLKATTGIHDASLGGRSNETSGVAIQKRNLQAQTSNFHFVDNLTRSKMHVGRIIVDLIPHIYDAPRAARIIGDDGEQKIVQLNQPEATPDTAVGKDGKPLLYAMDAGKYDVTMDVGPSFASKRQEAAASMIEVSKANPQIMAIAGDLLVKNMDWPGAQEVAERLRKTPQIAQLADDPNEKKPPIPPEIQAQMQQMGQMIDELTKNSNEQADIIQNKRLEIESKERIAMKGYEIQVEIELARLGAKEAMTLLGHEIGELNARQKMLRADQPIEDVTQDNGPMPGQPPGFSEPISGPGLLAAPGPELGAGGMDEQFSDPTGGMSPGSHGPEGLPQ